MRGMVTAVLLALVGPALAGPVGTYLGYEVGRTAIMHHWGRDSLHLYLPTPSDSVWSSDSYDTSRVVAETTYEGSPAWLIARSGSLTPLDTAVESGDSLLKQKFQFQDLSLWANAWRVPFSVGTAWRTGLEGTYYFDLNGDSLLDTLSIWGDTSRVLSIEDVAVPYDTLRDCYKVLTTLHQALGMVDTGIPLRESSYVRMWWWYKDSLWVGKDSSSITARAYMWFIVWLKLADIESDRTGELVDIYTGISEPATPEPRTAFSLCPNPARTSVRLSPVRPRDVKLYDSSGRELESVPEARCGAELRLDLKGLSPGVYLVRAGPAGQKLVITR